MTKPSLKQIARVFALGAMALVCPGVAHAQTPTITWNARDTGGNLTSGLWNVPTNWNPVRLPVPGDYVAIDQPGTYTVTMDVSPVIDGIKVGAGASSGIQTLDTASRSLTLQSTAVSSTIATGGTFVQRLRSTFTHAGRVDNAGTFNWLGGTVAGGTSSSFVVGPGGSLQINGSSTLLSKDKIYNYSQIALGATGDLTMSGSSLINRGVMNLTTNVAIAQDTAGTTSTLSNFPGGTLRKMTGGGTTTLGVNYSNGGIFEVQTGNLVLTGKGSSYGTFNIASRAMLDIVGPMNFLVFGTLGDTTTLNGFGTLAGKVRFDTPSAQVLAGAKLVNAGGVEMKFPSGGKLTVLGTYTQNAGQMTLAGGSVDGVGSQAPLTVNGGSIVGTGVIKGDVNCSGVISPASVAEVGATGLKEGAVASNLIAQPATSTGPLLGNINIGGNLIMDASGKIVLDVAGTGEGQYDRLVVDQNLSMDGNLTVQPLANSNFVFTAGQKFELVRANKFLYGLNHDFLSKTLPALSAGVNWVTGAFPDFAAPATESYILDAQGAVLPESVSITSPADSANKLSNLGTVNGSANAGSNKVGKVTVFLRRQTAAFTYQYWSGAAWTDVESGLNASVVLNGNLATFSLAAGFLPTGANLPNGTYAVYAAMVDSASTTTLSPVNTVTVNPEVAPLLGSISPASGSSVYGAARTLTSTYTDGNGASDIAEVRVMVSSTISEVNSLAAVYNALQKKFYLVADDGVTLLGGFAPGSANVIQNTRGSLNCATSTAVANGTLLTVTWSVTPKLPAVGNRALWSKVKDNSAVVVGYKSLASWLVLGKAAPTLGAVTPLPLASAAGTAKQITSIYQDLDGVADLKEVRLLVSATTSQSNSICAYYFPATNKLALAAENGTTLLGGFAPGSANVISNSYGSLNCSATSVSQVGSTITVKWSITPTALSAGARNVLSRCQDNSNLVAGYTNKGVWTVSVPAAPVVDAPFNPSGGSS